MATVGPAVRHGSLVGHAAAAEGLRWMGCSSPTRRAEVYVSADFCSTGLEVRVFDRPDVNTAVVSPADLGLSKRLGLRLAAWARWFNAVWELGLGDAPQRVRALGDAFDEVGRQLAQEVAAELGPSARVVYVPQGGWCQRSGRGRCLVVQE